MTPRALVPLSGRLVHIGTFLALALSLSAFLRFTLGWRPRLALELGLGAACAGVAEALQFWMPNHRPDWRGLVTSLMGVTLAGLLMVALRYVKGSAPAVEVVQEAGEEA